jgi:hypothetical protein
MQHKVRTECGTKQCRAQNCTILPEQTLAKASASNSKIRSIRDERAAEDRRSEKAKRSDDRKASACRDLAKAAERGEQQKGTISQTTAQRASHLPAPPHVRRAQSGDQLTLFLWIALTGACMLTGKQLIQPRYLGRNYEISPKRS